MAVLKEDKLSELTDFPLQASEGHFNLEQAAWYL